MYPPLMFEVGGELEKKGEKKVPCGGDGNLTRLFDTFFCSFWDL